MIYVCLFQHVQNDPPNAKGLAQLILQVIQFQEDSLGKSAKNPPFPRLPVSFFCILPMNFAKCYDILFVKIIILNYLWQVRHFLDFTPDGPLCHILSTMHQFKNEQGWRRFDFSSPSRKVRLKFISHKNNLKCGRSFHISPK